MGLRTVLGTVYVTKDRPQPLDETTIGRYVKEEKSRRRGSHE